MSGPGIRNHVRKYREVARRPILGVEDVLLPHPFQCTVLLDRIELCGSSVLLLNLECHGGPLRRSYCRIRA